MNMNSRLLLLVGSVLIAVPLHAQENPVDGGKLRGAYLGQRPPGERPEPFAPSFFDSRYGSFHSNIVFSPGGAEAFWQTGLDDGSNLQAVFQSEARGGYWTPPQPAFFSTLTRGGEDDAPFISPDGNRFFFLSRRALPQGGGGGKENIWVMERTEGGWSEPRPLPGRVNGLEGIHWQISVDLQSDLYFGIWRIEETVDGTRYTGEILVSRLREGGYSEPESLGPEINTPGGYVRSPFIAPDGRYLLFNRGDGRRGNRLFLSFRRMDGTWDRPRELSDVIGGEAWCPIVTADGKYLFFLSMNRGKIRPFWMDAGFIEKLRSQRLPTLASELDEHGRRPRR